MKGIIHTDPNTIFSFLFKPEKYFAVGRFRLLLTLFFFFFLTVVKVKSQEKLSAYEDISVLVQVDGYGGFYSDALYSPKGVLYISVEDLFRYLKIPCNVGQKGDSLCGFIENENRPYVISYQAGEINVNKKITDIKKGLIKQMGMLFMESSLFGQVFGIQLTSNFRSLSVAVKSDFELPVIKEQRLKKMRNNITKSKDEVIADTILGRNYHLLRFGMLDWSVMSSQILNHSTDTRLGLGVGAEVLGGEANVFLNYSNKYKFDNRQQQYLWRWVDNDKHLVRQVQAGKITAQTISSVYYPVVGAVVSNTPTSVRRAMGEYIINEVTQPDWFVELYINNVLMDFTRADASGLFMFKVPLVYGFTTLTLRFYGPMGEERSENRTMNVPYSFLPAGEFEYRLSAGLLQDGKQTPFGRGEANFGVCRVLTLGAGVEYLASITSGSSIPFVTASFLPMSKLMIKGEYAHGVRIRGVLNYYLWSNSMLEVDYTKYSKGQNAILYNYLEERKANFSFPLKVKNIAGFVRLGYKQNVYSNFKYNMAEILLSTYYKQFNANVSTYGNWVNEKSAYINSMVALSYRTKKGLTIRPSAQLNLSKGEILSYKAEIEKRFSHAGYISVSYENLAMSNYKSINLSFKYDLSFAQTSASVRFSNHEISASQGARGGLAFGTGNKHVVASELTTVGRGGITLIPFVDVNHNDIFDKGEQMVENLSVKINGGRVIYSKKDKIIRIVGLEPFISYNLELSDKDFENIAWRLKNKNYKVLIDPNQHKIIEIPIVPVGEVSGMIFMKTESVEKGLGRVLVNVYKKNGTNIAEILSESDGYFNFLGLEPGEYLVCIDSVQLKRLNFEVTPSQKLFTINATEAGDIVEGINFILTQQHQEKENADTLEADTALFQIDTSAKKGVLLKPADIGQKAEDSETDNYIINDTSYIIIHEVTQELITTSEESYAIQIGAFKNELNAANLRKKLEKQLERDFEIIVEDNLYKVNITGIKERKDVDEIISLLRRGGIAEVWVRHLEAKQQKWVLTEKQDTFPTIKESIDEHKVPGYRPGTSIQVGAFRREANAVALKIKLSRILDKQVVIDSEDGYFKVRIIGFAGLEDVERLLPSLRFLGMNEIWVLPVQKLGEQIPSIQPPADEHPETTKEVVSDKLQIQVMEEKSTVQVPTISLQVGVFHNRSKAFSAQRKITSKLKLPVKVVQQWDYFRVIITGFNTREETYKYYPELAGLGYPGVSLIETK